MPADRYGRYRLITRAIVLPPIKGRQEAAHIVGVGDRVTMQRAMRASRENAEARGYLLCDAGPNHAVYARYVAAGAAEGDNHPRLIALCYLVTDEELHRNDLEVTPALEVIT